MSLETDIQTFETKVKAFFQAELTVGEAIGSTVVQGVEMVVLSLEPTAVNDLKTMLQGIDSAFLAGSTLDSIAEEVMNQASTDLKALLGALNPQVLATLIGILIKAL